MGGGSRPVCRANCDQTCTRESSKLKTNHYKTFSVIAVSMATKGKTGFEDVSLLSSFEQKVTYLKSPNVFNSHHKLVSFSEDALTATLTLILLTLSSDGSVFLLLREMQ